MKVLWPRESILFHPSIPTILPYGIGCLFTKNQLPTDPPNYQNMAEGHGFRDIRAISITVRMVLGACRKLNPLEVCFQGPKYLPTNQQMSRDTSPTFTYSTSNLLPIFNKTSSIHSLPMLSTWFLQCCLRLYRPTPGLGKCCSGACSCHKSKPGRCLDSLFSLRSSLDALPYSSISYPRKETSSPIYILCVAGLI